MRYFNLFGLSFPKLIEKLTYEHFLAEFFVEYLMQKKRPQFSTVELENKLIETQRSIRAYMIPKGLLELRFQGHFYFI